MLVEFALCAGALAATSLDTRTVELPEGWTETYEVDVRDEVEVRHGSYEIRDAEGELRVAGQYADGLRDDTWRWHAADGETLVRGHYVKGERKKKWIFFHPGGEKRASGKFDGSLPVDEWDFWTPDKKHDLRHEGEYEAFHLQRDDGSRRVEGTLLDGVAHGRWTLWWPNGSPLLEGWYQRGVPVGTWRVWHADGTFDAAMSDRGSPEPFDGDLTLPTDPDLETLVVPVPLGELPPLATSPEVVAAVRKGIEHLDAEDPPEEEQLGTLIDAARLEPADRLAELVGALVDELAARPRGPHAATVAWSLASAMGGSTYGWSPGSSDADRAFDRTTLLRWRTLLELTRGDRVFWSLDAVCGSRAIRLSTTARWIEGSFSIPLDSVGAMVELTPELLWPQLPRPVGSLAPPPLYASRFAERRKDPTLTSALAWLVEHQNPNGGWHPARFCFAKDPCGGVGSEYQAVGVTALALLALMGDGNTPVEGEHAEPVLRGIRWLIEQQGDDGEIRSRHFVRQVENTLHFQHANDYLIGHSFATQALCEAAALTNSGALQSAAKRGIEHLRTGQNAYAAWRYEVPPNGENDMVSTAAAVEALSAARACGIEVPADVFERAISFVDEVTDTSSGFAGYAEWGDMGSRYVGANDHYDRNKAATTTAAALWIRRLLNQTPEEHPIVKTHAELLGGRPPIRSADGMTNDLCYWYWGALAMNEVELDVKKKWLAALREALEASPDAEGHLAGSVEPDGPWGYSGGRVYATAMFALCLEAEFRYDR